MHCLLLIHHLEELRTAWATCFGKSRARAIYRFKGKYFSKCFLFVEAMLQKIFATLLITAAPVCKYCDILGKFGQEMIFFISSVFILWENNNKPSEIQPKTQIFLLKRIPSLPNKLSKMLPTVFQMLMYFFQWSVGKKRKTLKLYLLKQLIFNPNFPILMRNRLQSILNKYFLYEVEHTVNC